MNILMMSNTYKPILGGLEKSVEAFSKAFRGKGHRVIIVAPEYENAPSEEDVIRIPAIQHFNGTDFSVQLPIPGVLAEALGDFRPDLVHSHHPFLIGDTALRVAYKHGVPLVFTHHTLYEQNTHYVSDSEAMKRFVVQLSIGYANLADHVFAPSESVLELLRQRGVKTPIDVVPTGIDARRFVGGADPDRFRERYGIPVDAFVVGHVGRLAPEKNLDFLAGAVAAFMKQNASAHFLVAGQGVSEDDLKRIFHSAGVDARLHLTGSLVGRDLADAYHAMDVFAFSSQSETQGLVLAEAMTAGVPVVAVDASGVREVVIDGVNGRLLPRQNWPDFAAALDWVASLNGQERESLKNESLKTAENFTAEKSARRAFKIYESLASRREFVRPSGEDTSWHEAIGFLRAQWDLTKNITKATTDTLLKTSAIDKEKDVPASGRLVEPSQTDG